MRTTDDQASAWALGQTRRIADAVRDLRGKTSAQTLSDITAGLGHRVTRAVIADLETGRRKYVTIAEVSALAAALGVTPAVLLTWGAFPDGEVEVLPARKVSALEAAQWYGGDPFPRYSDAATSLPRDNARVADLWEAARERGDIRVIVEQTLLRFHGGNEAVLRDLEARLDATSARVEHLGGTVIAPDTSAPTEGI